MKNYECLTDSFREICIDIFIAYLQILRSQSPH